MEKAESHDFYVSKYVMSTLLTYCVNLELHSVVIDIFSRLETKYKITLDIIFYSLNIKSLIKLKRIKKAMSVFEEMKRKNIKPDRHVYSILISGCTEVKYEDIGTSLHEEIVISNLNSNKFLQQH